MLECNVCASFILTNWA